MKISLFLGPQRYEQLHIQDLQHRISQPLSAEWPLMGPIAHAKCLRSGRLVSLIITLKQKSDVKQQII